MKNEEVFPCSWKGCKKEGNHAIQRYPSQRWAFVCDKHLTLVKAIKDYKNDSTVISELNHHYITIKGGKLMSFEAAKKSVAKSRAAKKNKSEKAVLAEATEKKEPKTYEIRSKAACKVCNGTTFTVAKTEPAGNRILYCATCKKPTSIKWA
jgi:hypothetical protein